VSVAVFGLGGTISMGAAGPGGAVPSLSTAQLVDAVAGLGAGEVDAVEFRRVPSASLEFADLAALAAAIRDQLTAGADGIVVIQGTDTIEETAYLLDLGHAEPEPIVVTGAMRTPAQAGADGPANILAAVRTAADPAVRGQGALVVFAEEIHAARWVAKTDTTSVGTFRSPTAGPLGRVVEGRPVLFARVPYRPVVPAGAGDPVVAVVPVVLGDEGVLLDGLAGRVDGVVLAAFGAGHVPQRLVPAVAALAARVPVVLASRAGAGPVLAATYGFPGSESDLRRRGLVGAGFLDPLKARLLLRQLLAAGADRPTIAAAFAVAGDGADPAGWPYGQDSVRSAAGSGPSEANASR
jgi:L-asparaginase